MKRSIRKAWKQNWNTIFPTIDRIHILKWKLKKKHPPHLGVHIVSVEIICKPVFIGTESLVASVNIQGLGPIIIDTAMAIAALDKGTLGV